MKKLSNKCGSCGYTLTFDVETQSLKCGQCGNLEHIEKEPLTTINKYNENVALKNNETHSGVFECVNCGAKTKIADNFSGVCPYCGSANLNTFADSFKFVADGVVPFYIDKSTAQKNYKQWIKTRRFVPNNLKSHAKLNKMEGYYFPCYCYSFNTVSSYSGVGVKQHIETHTVKTEKGSRIISTVHETKHHFSGNRTDKFKDLLINANNMLSHKQIDGLGNWGLEKLNVFNPAYLLGFTIKEQNKFVKDCYKEAMAEAEDDIKHNIELSHMYHRIENLSVDTQFLNNQYNYIYLPVWICNFIYKKKEYRFLVNGYCGYVAGKVPRSVPKILSLVFGIGLIALAIALLIAKFNGV